MQRENNWFKLFLPKKQNYAQKATENIDKRYIFPHYVKYFYRYLSISET